MMPGAGREQDNPVKRPALRVRGEAGRFRLAALFRWVRMRLYQRYGHLPMTEYRRKVREIGGVTRLWRHERRESKRLLAELGGPIEASVITIIATYRRPRLAAQAVCSALAQSIADHRILVIDDSGGQLPAVNDPRVTLISLERNAGTAGIVRNVGIRLSRSPFIAFLDDDNSWEPDHLEVSLLERARGAQLTYTGIRRVRPDGSVIDTLSVPFDRDAMRDAPFVDTSSVVVDRTRAVRFSRVPRGRDTNPKEDWELVFRLSRHLRTLHIPRVTVEYLVHDGSYYSDW